VVGCLEHAKETLGSIKGWEFVGTAEQFLHKNATEWS
jgi:hypothetical protein